MQLYPIISGEFTIQNIHDFINLGSHKIPGLWSYLLPKDFFSLNIPEEKKSSCSSCPEVKDSGYRKDYRCCTFQPRIPNYNLGLGIQSKNQYTHKVISKLHNQNYLIPEGLIASPKRWELFLNDLSKNQFGKSNKVLCDFLDTKNGLCGIYNYRNGPCSTFFCHNDHGELGAQFWDSLMIYINQIEHALSQWTMGELGLDPKEYYKVFNSFANKIPEFKSENLGWPHKFMKSIWGNWYGKELQFFQETALLIENNKKNLITIAESFHTLESLTFEKAAIQSMPINCQEQVDESDLSEGNPTPLSELFKILMFDYREMIGI